MNPPFLVHFFPLLLAILFPAMPANVLAQSATVQDALSVQEESQHHSKQAQIRIDSLDDATRQAATEYRIVLEQLRRVQKRNTLLESEVARQQRRHQAIIQQLAELDTTRSNLVPTAQRMLDSLEQLVSLDSPFLAKERQTRISVLKTLLASDASGADKLKRMFEAFQIEMGYGRSLEAYTAHLPGSVPPRNVDLLRVGRIGLFYLTLDGNQAGRWDQASGRFTLVSDSARLNIKRAIEIARKQRPTELVPLPIATPSVEVR